MKIEELSKAVREDMPIFEANLRYVLRDKNRHKIGIKHPHVKLWKPSLLRKCKNWNAKGIEDRLKVFGIDVKVSTTSGYATLKFKNEFERTKFLWTFDYPGLKEENKC